MDAASLEAMDAPRSFHYVFAHRALPMLAAKDAKLLQKVLKRDGASFLRMQWKATCRALDIEPQPSEAIGYGPGSDEMGRVALGYAGHRRIAGYDVAFVQLPLALQVREAHFVAIVRQGRVARFVAWERTLEGGARLAEWTLTPDGPKDRRVGPIWADTGLEAFVKALGAWLTDAATLAQPGERRARPERRSKPNRPALRLVERPSPIVAPPVVTKADALLVGSLLGVWGLMILVLTLL